MNIAERARLLPGELMTNVVAASQTPGLPGRANTQSREPRGELIRWFSKPATALALIVVSGAALRVVKITDYSLWGDEGFSAAIVMQPWRPFWLSILYEPWTAFYFVLLKPWTLCFGTGEVALRSLSVVFGLVAIVAIYYLGERLFSRRAGLIAAAMTAVSPVQIWYSQEVRGYSVYVLLSALCWLAFLAALHNSQPRNLSIWSVLMVLTGYCHFIGLGIIPAQWVCIAIRRPDFSFVKRLAVATAAAAVALALIPIFMVTLNSGQAGWIAPLSWAEIADVFVTVSGGLHGNVGAIFCLTYVLLLVWALLGSYQKGNDQSGWESCAFASAGFLVPIMATIAGGFFVPMLIGRYLLLCFPPFVVLAAQGLLTVRPRKAALIVVAALVAMSAWELRDSYNLESRDDWRSTAQYVMRHGQPGDAAIFVTPECRYAFQYYAAQEPKTEAFPVILGENRDLVDGIRIVTNRFPSYTNGALGKVDSLPKSYRRIWLMKPGSIDLDTRDPNKRESVQLAAALAHEYRTHPPVIFNGVSVWLYDTPDASAAAPAMNRES